MKVFSKKGWSIRDNSLPGRSSTLDGREVRVNCTLVQYGQGAAWEGNATVSSISAAVLTPPLGGVVGSHRILLPVSRGRKDCRVGNTTRTQHLGQQQNNHPSLHGFLLVRSASTTRLGDNTASNSAECGGIQSRIQAVVLLHWRELSIVDCACSTTIVCTKIKPGSPSFCRLMAILPLQGYGSNAKMHFQSFFMLMTTQPCFFASSYSA